MMKKILNQFLLTAALTGGAMTLTSCQGLIDAIFGDIDNPVAKTQEELEAEQVAEAVALLNEAQEEGSLTTMYFTIGSMEYEATYKKEGDNFMLQELKNSKAGTRTRGENGPLGNLGIVRPEDLTVDLEMLEIADLTIYEWGADCGGGSSDGGGGSASAGGADDEQAGEAENETIVDENGNTWNYAEADGTAAEASAADIATEEEIEKDEGYTDGPAEEDPPIEDDPVEDDPSSNSAMPEASDKVMHFKVTDKTTGQTLVETYTNLGNSETTQEGVSGVKVSSSVTVNGTTKTLGQGNKECKITLPNGNVVTMKYKDKYDTWNQLIRKQKQLKLSSEKGIVKYSNTYWVLDGEKAVDREARVGASYKSSTKVKGLVLYANVDKGIYSKKKKKNNFRKGDMLRVRVEFNKKSSGAVMRGEEAFSVFKATSSVAVRKVDGYKNVFEIEALVGPSKKNKFKAFSVTFAYKDYNGAVKKEKFKGYIGYGEGDSQTGGPAAKVTTAPKATAGTIEAGSTTALVSAGVTDVGEMMYKATAENTKPTTTDGFSSTIPTAKELAAGTWYVWYYAKGDATHSDSEIAGPIEVTVTKPTAKVTTEPTAKTITFTSADADAIINAGTTSEGTMKYAVSANNSQPNDDQFSENVPTVADMLTTLGSFSLGGDSKVYVWYKVFGDDTHADSKIEGPIEVTVTEGGISLGE